MVAIAVTPLTVWWQLAGHPASPTGVLAIAAVVLAAALAAVLLHARPAGSVFAAWPLLRRAAALRRKSWGAAFQRQRDPDAAGRARPRAPSAAPAAA